MLSSCATAIDDLPGGLPRPTPAVATAENSSGLRHSATPVAEDLASAIPRLFGIWLECTYQPSECEVDSLAAPTSDAHQVFSAEFDTWARDGRFAITASPPPRVVVESLRRVDANHADAIWCWIDDLVVVAASRSSGAHAVFDDNVMTLRWRWSLESSPGGWRIADIDMVDWEMGSASWCRP